MLNAFFNDLIKIKEERQVIILDNKIPESDVISKINFIQFRSDTDSSRRGFFPK